MGMARFRRIFMTMAVFAVAAQTALAAPVCEGEYTAAINGVATPVQGKVASVPNPYRTQQVRVDVTDCGRTLVIHGDGAMALTQTANDSAHYVGSAQGMMAVFDVWSPDRLTGQVLFPGSKGGVIYEMTLVGGHAPNLEGCGDPALKADTSADDRLTIDPALRAEVINIVADELGVPREKAGRYISAARTVAKTRSRNDAPTVIAPGEGNCPEEFAGVRECLEFPSDITTIVETNVLIDKDGRLLPVTTEGSSTDRVRVDDPGAANFCAPEAILPPAEKRLRFTFFAIEQDGINDVQAVLADADTDVADAAFYAERHDGGQQARIEATNEAYAGVGAPVTGLH